jgi:proline dehydrogenase
VPYPGGPLDSDAKVVARPVGDVAEDNIALLSLKGDLTSMGVLETDEGLRKGDLEALSALWVKLRSLGQRAQRNG